MGTLPGRKQTSDPRTGVMHVVKAGEGVPAYSYFIEWDDIVIAMKEDHPIIIPIVANVVDLPTTAKVGKQYYVRGEKAIYVYDIDSQWYPTGGSATSWEVLNVSSGVSPAQPYKYYKVDASANPVVFELPDPVAGCNDEFDFELTVNTHKVTITTVGGVTGAIQGYDSIIIPNIGGRLKLKCNSINGYEIILDTRVMDTVIPIIANRDFSSDGFEHMSIYEVSPNPSGSNVLLTLPPPSTFDQNKSIRANFKLTSEGSITIVRSDGGFIGSLVQQDISTVDSGITISEAEGKYSIIQDSRPKLQQLSLIIPYFRLTDLSDLGGIYYALAPSKDDARYGAENLVLTPVLLDATVATPANYVSYVTDLGYELGDLVASTATFYVTTRKVAVGTTSTDRNVKAYYALYKRTSGGTETLIAQTSQFIVTQDIFQQFPINLVTPDISFAATDRLVMKVFVGKTATGGIDPQLETKIEGPDGAYFGFNIPSTSVKHNNLAERDASNAHPAQSISYKTTNVENELNNRPHFQTRFSTTITEADPGTGYVRGNNATQANITELYISSTEYNNGSLQAFLNALSTDSVIGLKALGNRSKWANYKIGSILVDNTGWWKIEVSVEAKGTDFADEDVVGVYLLSKEIKVITDEQPTTSLKFDKPYWPDETRQITMSGDLNLTLDTGVVNIVGNSNFFDVIADGVGAINLTSGFKANGIFPTNLDGLVLDAGTYLFCCVYSPNGIVVNVPALGGTSGGGTAPNLVSATILDTNLNEVLLEFDIAVNITDGSGFSLSGTTDSSFASVSGSGTTTITGTLTNAATELETILLSYNSALGNVVSTSDSTPLESFSNQSVVVGDTTAPLLLTASIGDVADNVIRLTYDEALNESFVPQLTDYVIDYDTISQTVTNVSVTNNIVDITVSASATSDTVVVLDYTQSSGNEIQDQSANKAVNLTGQSVTNLLDFGIALHIMDEANMTVDGSDFVSEVTDLSSNGNNLVQALDGTSSFPPSNLPSIIRSYVNGKDVLTFTDAGLGIENKELHSNRYGMTCIISYRTTNSSDCTLLSNYCDIAGNVSNFERTNLGGAWMIGISGQCNAYPYKGTGRPVSAVSPTFLANQWSIAVLRYTPAKEWSVWINNVKSTASDIPYGINTVGSNLPTWLGFSRSGINFYLEGQIRKAQVFERALGNDELSALIESYATDVNISVDTSSIVETTPVIQSAIVGRSGDNKIRIHYDNLINYKDAIPASSFSLSGTTATISSIEVGASHIDLLLNQNILSTDTVLLSYTPDTISVSSPNGQNQAASFSNYAVSNYVLDESTASLLIDARRSDSYTLNATDDYIVDNINEITNNTSITAADYTPASTSSTHRMFLKDVFDGSDLFLNSQCRGNMPIPYNITNGFTIYAVVNPNTSGNVIAQWNQFQTDSYKWRLSTTLFQVRDTTPLGAGVVFTTPAPTTDTVCIIAGRWTPGTEIAGWMNGEEAIQTSNIAIGADMAINDTMMSLNRDDWAAAGGATAGIHYIIGFPTAQSQAEVKATIDLLAARYNVPNVDTSGIV